ncbi:hypothetical protein LEP1GSC186_3239 [Leptospira noguchii serovar Autumnalis str. ZUN142]|uniref:Uncharacterized protein n=2 Tax=Leptospira TaxID=171 RepID=M6U4Z2_9LEPT|nr:hypothetical protein LEP1GSC186_3239 [Leptospira noguchii serovar Autumnalis str. ZUN142]
MSCCGGKTHSMNQDLILQQIGGISQIAKNKGLSEEEASNEAYTLVKGLLSKTNEIILKNPSLNKELIFHQMSTQAFGIYHSKDDIDEVLDSVFKSISEKIILSKKLSDEFSNLK